MSTVAVFFGGASCESEVSVITGMHVCNLLRGGKYRVVPVYLPPEGGMVTGKMRAVGDVLAQGLLPVRLSGSTLVKNKGKGRVVARFDVALNCCHGGMGEDGTLSALFAWNGVLTASPRMPESALFMDKSLTKLVAMGLGIDVAPSVTVWEGEDVDVEKVKFPLVVKPARLGSSIGVQVVRTPEELSAAMDFAMTLDDHVLLEQYFEAKRDVNCAAVRMGDKVLLSPLEEVFSSGDVLSFTEKYEQGKGSRIPADLPEGVGKSIEDATRRIYEALGMQGVVRADFLVVGERAYFNELNMVPGSLAGYLFSSSLSEMRKFYEAVLDDALARPVQKRRILRTGILSRGVFSGAKGCKRR